MRTSIKRATYPITNFRTETSRLQLENDLKEYPNEYAVSEIPEVPLEDDESNGSNGFGKAQEEELGRFFGTDPIVFDGQGYNDVMEYYDRLV